MIFYKENITLDKVYNAYIAFFRGDEKMQYNKKQFNKVNDKKMMKKVKKQWVVVSIASLAFLGASAYGMLNTTTVAKADTNATSSYNNNDETTQYASQIQQGAQDAFQNKGNNSSSLSGQASNYYNAAYNGAQSALNAYNTATQNTGAGTQDYNYYGNTVTKQDGYDSDSANAQTGSKGFSSKRKTEGDNSADKQAQSDNSQVSTDTTQSNPTDGTPLNSTNPNDTNQGGADNPKDASTSVSNYESTMVNKLNTSTNTSVKATSPTQNINIPTANTDAIVNDRKQYANYTGLGKAFDYGVNYVLTQQGMADAESGKWQGVYAGSNGNTQDYYLNSATNTPSNAYDQAYRGARNAMNDFFSSSNTYNGSTSVSASSTGNTAYDAGFNDVVNQANQGIVYVQNGQQYQNIMTGSTASSTVSGNIAQDNNGNTFKIIRLANDIDLSGATNGENNGTVYTNQATLTVDGQNHMMDFHGNNYIVSRTGNGSLDVYLQNFQTMYGANFWGTFRAENGAVFHFSNINYVGPQLLSSYSNDTYFSGNVNVLVPTASPNYTSPFQSNVNIEGNGDQENLEVNNFILEPNSNYFGNTSTNYGGTNVVVTGNFTIGENAKMTLIPRGGNGGAATTADGSTWGVWLRQSGASLNINKNATLNIIPQLLTSGNYQNMFGGGVYSGNNVSININGGTLNYEGYNGISGYYNQPIDLQGSSNTQINVINGGVMQVVMDSVPDVTTYNSYAGHQSVYDGLINNVGLGNFNVGSRGNLKVGVTNSDSTYNVPYYGPININSVGSNHVIFMKSGAVQQFQTTTGTSGTGYAGNINAYTVAIKQADGTNQYLYNFTLNSGSTSYTGVDLNGNQINGNISGNLLEISDVPSVQFVGPISKQTNGDGTTTVTAYAKLSNYKQLNNQPIYVGIASSNSNGSYNQLTQMPNSNVTDAYSKADPNTYTLTVNTAGYTGGIIPITYTIPSEIPTNYIGVRLHYGINSVNSILAPQSYSSTVEGYQNAGNGKVVETSSGDMQVANGQLGDVNSGISDAIADSISNTTSNKDGEPFNTKTNDDYLAAYNAIQAGYQAYTNSTANQDYTKLSSYINSSNPSAFAQGYREAAYQAGLNDARFNKSNVTNNANYSEAQSQYNTAYQAALSNPGTDISTLISQNNLPAITSNGTSATAVTTAISDAQGVLSFFSDEKAANINGTNYNNIKTDKSKVAAYNDAATGFYNALRVTGTSANPDSNADKAETAGFDYAQSIINGGLSKTQPSATTDHMNNLAAAINGYQANAAATSKAQSNGASSNDAKSTTHDGVSTDNFNGDLTAYKSIKFGAYTGLSGKSDAGLNTLEKVGYTSIIGPASYQAGIAAFNNNAGNTPTGVAAQSQTGQTEFAKGYADAQASFNQGTADGSTAVKSNSTTSTNPGVVPAGVVSKDAYSKGYADSVNAYAHGASSFSPTNQQTATPTGNDAVNDNVKSAYTKGYSDAQASFTSGTANGSNDVKSNPSVSSSNATVPTNIPSDTANQNAYKQGYQAAVNAYANGANAFNTNGSTTATGDNAVNDNVKSSYNQGYQAAEASYNQGKSTGLSAAQSNAIISNSVSSLPASVAGSNGSQYATNSSAYSTGYKGAVDGYTDGDTSTGQQNKKDSSAGQNYQSAYANGYSDGRATAGANDYLTKHSKAANDSDYSTGYSNAAAGHDSGYSAASSAASTNTSVPSASTVNPSANYQYTVGFNGGVSDEGKDAGAKVGATAFLNNSAANSLTNSNAQSGFNDAASGFNDALTGKSQASGANSNYAAGYSAYASAAAAWNSDEQNNGSQAQANGSATATTVTNDIFNSIASSLNGQGYINAQNSTGNMYSQIASKFASQASFAYSSAVTSALSNASAAPSSNNDYFVNKAIQDTNDGFNGVTTNGNTNAAGYLAGKTLKANETAGITLANTNANAAEPSDPDQKSAFDATKQAYQDVINDGGAKSVSGQSRSYQDAYAQAVQQAQQQLNSNKNTAISAVKNKQGTPFTSNSASDVAWNKAYEDMQRGYTAAKSGISTSVSTNANYNYGFTIANAFAASVKAAEDNTSFPAQHLTQTTDQVEDVDAYNGVIDAINQVYSNGAGQSLPQYIDGQTTNQSADYVQAYNSAIEAAYRASQKAQTDMTKGVKADATKLNGTDTKDDSNANKAVYQNAYVQTSIGFSAGLNGGSYPSNADRQKGYNYSTGAETGQSLSKGYQDAVNDFLTNGGSTSSSNTNEPGYQDTIKALQAANSGQSNPSTSALSNYAYSHQLAAKNALADIANGNSNNQNPPAGVDANIYAEAYAAVKSGYADATEKTTPIASDHKSQTDTTTPYTASYQQGFTAGRIIKGANDFVNGSVDSGTESTDANYQKGVQEAQAGYTDGKSGNNNQATQQQINTNDQAYQIGHATGQNSKDGAALAQDPNSNPNGLTGDALNAYYAVKDAYNQVMKTTSGNPSDGNHNVSITSQAYQDAYKKALSEAQAAEKQGQAQFASQSAEPIVGNNMASAALKNGYDQAKSGYQEEQAALKNNSAADVSNSSKNDSYNAGVAMAKNVQAGINAYVNSSQPSGDAQQAAFDAAQQAYADAKTNNNTANPTSNVDNANKQLYTDAYQQAKANADSQVQAGINDYLAGNPKSGKSDQNSVLHDSSMSDAQTGFNDVMNNNATTPAQANNSAYMGGYNAAKSVQQAITDLNNGQKNQNEANAANKSAYDSAVSGGQQALDDAKNGQFTNTPSGNPEYNSAYKAMQQVAVNAHQQGITDASNNPFQSADPKVNNLKNADAQSIANSAYKQVKDGFNAAFNNQTISNPTDANQAGSSLANSAKQYVDALASGTNPSANIPQAVIDKINALQTKVNNAFNANPQASDVDPDDSDPFSQYVYKKLMDQNQTNYSAGIAQAKQLGNSNSTNPAYNKGYSDFTNGLISAIKNNGSTNGVAANVKDDVTAAYNSYEKGIKDTSEPNGSGVDPIEKTAYDAYQQGKSADHKSSDQVQTDLNNLSSVAQQAYIKGYNDQQDADKLSSEKQSGLADFKNGQTSPSDPSQASVDSFNAAQAGYKAGQSNSKDADKYANDSSYKYGYDLGQALQAAKQNVQTGNLNTTDKQTMDAQTAIANGIKDAENNSNNNAQNDSSSSQRLYSDAYNAGKTLGTNALATGANAYVAGNAQPTDGQDGSIAHAQVVGYQDAQSGFTAGSVLGATNTKQSDPSYTTGFNAAQTAAIVIDNIQNGHNTTTTDAANTTQATNGYADAASAFEANPDHPSASTNTNPAYNLAYNSAISHLTNQYQAGINDFTSGKNAADVSAANSQYDKDAINKGYNDAQTGFQAAMSNSSSYNNSTADKASQAGYALGQLVQQGINTINNSTDKSASANTGNTDVNTAIQAARDNVLANPAVLANSVPSSITSSVARQAYIAAVNAFEQEYQTGVNKVVNGTASDKQNDAKNDVFAQQGVSDAIQAIKDGFNGVTNSKPNLRTLYQMGADAKTGVTEANSGQHSSDNESAATKAGNQAALDAISHASSQNANQPVDNSSKSEIYQLAYAQGQQQSTTLTNQGLNGFINGQNRPTGMDAASQLAQQAYDEALRGYHAAQSGDTSTDGKSAAYQAGVKAYQDAQDGIKYAQDNQSVPTGVSQAEQLAAKAVMDAYNGNNESNANNSIYHDAYVQEIQNKQNYAKQGAIAGASDTAQNTAGMNNIDKEAYQQGYSDAQSGYQAALTNITRPVDTLNSGVNKQDAQNGAIQAFKDVLAGGNPDKLTAPTNASAASTAAYNKALQDAKTFIQTAKQDALNGVTPSSAGNDASSQIINYVYQNIVNGYQSARDNKYSNAKNDLSNKDPYFQQGVGIANDLDSRLTAFTNNASADSNSVEAQAYNDGINNQTTHQPQAGSTNYLENSDLYAKIHDAAKQNADKGSADFVAGNPRDTNNTTLSDKAQQQAYDSAKQGFDDQLSGHVDSTNQSPSYLKGQAAAQAVQAAENNIQNGNNGSNASDQASYNMAASGYQKAYQAFMASTDPSKLSSTPDASDMNANNPAYQKAYTDAMSHLLTQYKQGISQFNNGNTSAQTDNVAGNLDKDVIRKGFQAAQAVFNDGLNGQTNANSNADTNDDSTLANKVKTAINNAVTDGNVDTGNSDINSVINAAKAAILNNPAASATDYSNVTPNITNNLKYQLIYQNSIAQFKAAYQSGVNSATVGNGDGTIKAVSGKLATLGQNDANNAIQAGFGGQSNPFSSRNNRDLNTAYEMGQDAKTAMGLRQKGQTSLPGNASAAEQSGFNAANDAINDLINHRAPASDINSKLQTYQLAYNASSTSAGFAATDGAKALFTNNPNNDANNTPLISNANNIHDVSYNQGLSDAKQALTDAQANDPSLDSKYTIGTIAGDVYFATKAAYSKADNDKDKASQYADKIAGHESDPVVQAAYDDALTYANKAALTGENDGANFNKHPEQFTNPYAQAVYVDNYNAANGAFNDAENGVNADKYQGKGESAATYAAIKAAISDYLAGNQAHATNTTDYSGDAATAYHQAYVAFVNSDLQKAIESGIKGYAANNTSDQIQQAGKAIANSLGAVAQAAAQRAQNGYADAKQNKNASNDYAYQAGQALAQSEQKGVNEALNDVTATPYSAGKVLDNNQQAEQDGFKATVDGYKLASTGGSLTKDTLDDYINQHLANASVAYRDAFKSAYLDGLSRAQAGAQAALGNQADAMANAKGAADLAQHNGYVNANSAFIDALHGTNTNQYPDAPTSAAGLSKAQAFLKAIQDAVAGKENQGGQTDYQNGYDTAQKAIKDAINDAKMSKKLPDNDNDIVVPDGYDPTVYRDVYKAIFNGYTNGYNSRDKNANQNYPDYAGAFNYGYKRGNSDIPVPDDNSVAPIDFLHYTKKSDSQFANDFEASSYSKNYVLADDGFSDGLTDKTRASFVGSYSKGYQAGFDAIAGMKLAQEDAHKSVSELAMAMGSSFANGYSGYLEGIKAAKRNLAENKKLSKKDLEGKDRVYVYTFKEGLKQQAKIQKEDGAKAGVKNAAKRHSIPENIYKNHSEYYAHSYITAYKNEMKRRMPKYIYNVKTIFTHSRVKFSKQTRIKKYAYTKRYNSTVFKVTGIAYYKNGIPRYRLSNGAIVTASDHVENAYYQHNFNFFKVIKPKGVLVHTDKKYSQDNVVRRLKRDQVFKVQKVVKYHGLTRLYIGNGDYITSNKTYVQKVDKK